MKPDYPDLKPDYALYENDHKPFRPYSYTDNNFNSVTANPKNQRVLPANPVIPAYLKHQHEPHVSLNRYPEHTNSIPHIPPNSINGYKESSPQMNGHVSGQKRPDPTETVPKGFYDRRKPRTDIDVHHNDVSPKDNPGTQAPQIKRKPLTAHNINELARIIGQANTNHDPYQYRANKPKTKRPSSGQKRGDTEHHGSSKPKIKSQGFNYGIPRTKVSIVTVLLSSLP